MCVGGQVNRCVKGEGNGGWLIMSVSHWAVICWPSGLMGQSPVCLRLLRVLSSQPHNFNLNVASL